MTGTDIEYDAGASGSTGTQDDAGWTDWIEHNGGPCPIPDAKEGEYQLRFRDGANGSPSFGADTWHWRKDSVAGDITHYRLRKPATPSYTRDMLSQAFITSHATGGEYYVKVKFRTLAESQAFHGALVRPATPSPDLRALLEQAVEKLGTIEACSDCPAAVLIARSTLATIKTALGEE